MEDIERLQEFLNKGMFYLQQSSNSSNSSNSSKIKALQNLRLAGGHLEHIISKIENLSQPTKSKQSKIKTDRNSIISANEKGIK